jgi:hypothetical protein
MTAWISELLRINNFADFDSKKSISCSLSRLSCEAVWKVFPVSHEGLINLNESGELGLPTPVLSLVPEILFGKNFEKRLFLFQNGNKNVVFEKCDQS